MVGSRTLDLTTSLMAGDPDMTQQAQPSGSTGSADSSEGATPADASGRAVISAADRAKELLKRGAAEVQQTARVTTQQFGRLYDYGSKRWSSRRLQRRALAAQAALGRRLNELGIGDAN